jgi:hypothetical protein
MTPGDEIEAIRRKHGFSRPRLADWIGVHPSTLKKCARGEIKEFPELLEAVRAVDRACENGEIPIEERRGLAGRPPNQANGADDWLPQAATAAATGTLSAALLGAMRSPWFWIIIALVMLALFLVWRNSKATGGPHPANGSRTNQEERQLNPDGGAMEPA